MKQFPELRETLLRAGVAPRHVRRYIAELQDHLVDLTAEEQGRGLGLGEAQFAALNRLGAADTLTTAVLSRRQLYSWCARTPWAVFGVMPLLITGGIYLIACLVLWSGWRMFLPGTDTPFVPVSGLAAIYFSAGRFLYYAGPILGVWGIGLVAARQRCTAGWPILAFVLGALLGSAAQVHAAGPAFANGAGNVSMSFNLSNSFDFLRHFCALFAVAALPYLVWLGHKAAFHPTGYREC